MSRGHPRNAMLLTSMADVLETQGARIDIRSLAMQLPRRPPRVGDVRRPARFNSLVPVVLPRVGVVPAEVASRHTVHQTLYWYYRVEHSGDNAASWFRSNIADVSTHSQQRYIHSNPRLVLAGIFIFSFFHPRQPAELRFHIVMCVYMA